MRQVRILWPDVWSSEGKHLQDETPMVSFADADALIACGAAEDCDPEAEAKAKAAAEAEAKAAAEAEAKAAAEAEAKAQAAAAKAAKK